MILSKYAEGSVGTTKGVELYNGTGATVDLSQYALRQVNNGGTSTNTFTFSAALAPGATWVLCNASSVQALLDRCDQTSGSLTFNGNDTLVLLHSGTQVDSFGDGTNPGISWGTGVSSKDSSLRRKCSVTAGTTALPATFDPAVEWETVAGEAVEGFGTWHCGGGSGSSSGPAPSSSAAGTSSSAAAVSSSSAAVVSSSSAALSSSTSLPPALALVVAPPPAYATTSESGGTASFGVRLPQAPTADVVVAVSSQDTSEVTVDKGALTFTPANWNTVQMVTLTGVDDPDLDGPVATAIRVGPAQSTDSRYQGSTGTGFSITNTDNDVAGVKAELPDGNSTHERGRPLRIKLSLSARPTAAVQVDFASSDSTAGTLDVTRLSFDAATWNVAQVVHADGVDDTLLDGPQSWTVQFSTLTSTDAQWSGVQPAAVPLVTVDDELQQLTLSSSQSSVWPSLSGDGRTVAFGSELILGMDFNGAALDLVVGDLVTGSLSNKTYACSTAGLDRAPVMAANAMAVVFQSSCNELRSGAGSAGQLDIYVWTPEAGVERVSLNASGVSGGGASNPQQYSISADGRTVAFATHARFTAADTDSDDDIYLYDRLTQQFTLVTGAAQRRASDVSQDFFIPAHAFGGQDRYFIYRTVSNNLVANDTNNAADIFRYDLQTGVTDRVSVNQDGSQTYGTEDAAMSTDGNHVAMIGSFRDFQGNSQNGFWVKDYPSGQLTFLAPKDQYDWDAAVDINGDGSTVLILTRSDGVAAGDNNDAEDVLAWNRATGTFTRISVGPGNRYAPDTYWSPNSISIAPSAPYAAFDSSFGYLGNDWSANYYSGADILVGKLR